jgi:citrate lyase beta subunit
MIANVAGLGADLVLVDLEDAVAPAEKTDETRSRVVAALRVAEWDRRPGRTRRR